MSVPRTIATLVLGLLLGSEAHSLERASSSGELGRNRCHGVRIEAVGSSSVGETHGKRRRVRKRFSARELLDLRFRVPMAQGDQSGLVEIAIYAPSGNLYETLQAQLDLDDSGRSVARGAHVVAANLPVAGSQITARSLYGEWRAEVHLDGNEASCSQAKFLLDP